MRNTLQNFLSLAQQHNYCKLGKTCAAPFLPSNPVAASRQALSLVPHPHFLFLLASDPQSSTSLHNKRGTRFPRRRQERPRQGHPLMPSVSAPREAPSLIAQLRAVEDILPQRPSAFSEPPSVEAAEVKVPAAVLLPTVVGTVDPPAVDSAFLVLYWEVISPANCNATRFCVAA